MEKIPEVTFKRIEEKKEGIKLKEILTEYAAFIASLGDTFCSKRVINDADNFPEYYLPPTGCFLVAVVKEKFIGSIGIRKLNETDCELKRMFVLSAYRRLKLGTTLLEKIIDEAKKMGYKKILLDTISDMTAAIALYKKIGFIERGPYSDEKWHEGKTLVYMELDLTKYKSAK